MALNEYLDGIEGLAPGDRQRLLDMVNQSGGALQSGGSEPRASMPENIPNASGAPPVESIPNATGPTPVQPASDWRADLKAVMGEAQARGIGNKAAGPGHVVQQYGQGVQAALEPTPAAPAGAAPLGPNPVPPPRTEGDDDAPIIMSPGRYVPGGWRDTNRSESIHHGLDPSKLSEGQRQRAVADNYGAWANDDVRKAAEKEATAEVAYAAAHREASVLEAERQKRIENEKQAYIIREHEKLAELSQAAQQHVDPEAAKGSSGAQLFAALGVALGEFGASLRGGTNTALQIVNANIDRNIRAQEANINNAHKALATEQSLYKDNLAAFGDKERASLATKMQMLDQAKTMLDEQYAGAKTNRNDAQYHAMAQGLADRRAEVADRFGTLTADQRTTQGAQHYQQGGMVGGGATLGEKGKEGLYVPSLHIYARSESEAKELRANSARTQNTVRELNNVKGLIEQARNTNNPKKLAEIQRNIKSAAARAAITATVKEGQGAMSEGDRLVAESGLGLADVDVGTLSSLNPMAPSLDSQTRSIDSAITAHQQEYGRMGSGGQRGTEVYIRNPVTGKVEARQVLVGKNAPERNQVDNLDDKVVSPVGQSSRKK